MSILANRKPARKPRPKPARFVRLAVPLNADGKNGVIRIREVKGVRNPREVVDDYFLSRVASDFGDGFHVEKIGEPESSYHVHLSNEGHTCECKGYLSHGYCRHALALAALRADGRL